MLSCALKSTRNRNLADASKTKASNFVECQLQSFPFLAGITVSLIVVRGCIPIEYHARSDTGFRIPF